MRKITPLAILASFILIVCCVACHKNISGDQQRTATREVVFPRNAQEQFMADKIKRVGQIIKEIYRDPAVRREVNAAILSKYYVDETVPLADLLEPSSSPMFKSEAYVALHVPFGHFRSRFIEQIGRSQTGSNQKSYLDSLQEYFMRDSITIYFPYSENFTLALLERTGLSIFAADRDADEAPGEKELLDLEGRVSGHEAVIGNDPYSEVNPCHIVGVNCIVYPNTDIGFYDSVPVPSSGGQPMALTQVYVGWACSNQMHDAWISFTGNGGGDEMRFCRTSGFLEYDGSQVTSFQNRVSVQFSRSECKGGRWRRIYAVWDPSWDVDDLQQTLTVYEEDSEGNKTVTGKITTTLSFTVAGATITAPGDIGYSIMIKTKDDIFYQQEWTRNEYLETSANYNSTIFQTTMSPILLPRGRPNTPPVAPEPGVWNVQFLGLFWRCSLQSSNMRTDGRYWPLHTNDNSNPDFMLMWPHMQ